MGIAPEDSTRDEISQDRSMTAYVWRLKDPVLQHIKEKHDADNSD